MIKPFAFLVTLRELQTLFTPNPLDFLVIYRPAFDTQEFIDFAVAIASILLR